MTRKFLKSVLSLMAVVLVSVSSFGQANSENPYDYAGALHNELLTNFFKKKQGYLNVDETLILVKEVAMKNRNYTSRFGNNYIDFPKGEINKFVADYPNKFVNYIDQINLSNPSKGIIKEVVLFTMDEKNKDISLENYRAYLVQKERAVLNMSLSTNEKEILLSSLSVLRHSAYFWENQAPNQAMGGGQRRSILSWVADGVGAVVGGVLGAPGVLTAAGGAVFVGTGASAVVDAIEDSSGK